MKKIMALSLAVVLLQSSFLIGFASAQTKEILTNSSIVEMLEAGLSEQVIISLIKTSDNSFDTSALKIMELKKAGVSDAIILALVEASSKKADEIPKISTTDIVASPPKPMIALTLLDGTPVKLRIGRTISSKDATVGETIDFEVLEDIVINNLVVIPRGGIAIATVTRAKPRGRLGKGGKLDINVDFVRAVTGEKIALRAVKETKGGSHTGAMTGAIVATSILFFPAAPFFLFMKGKDISIPKGTEV